LRIQNKGVHCSMILEGENTHGGKRNGAGAKKKYGEETETISFRCPVSKVEKLKSLIKKELEKLLSEKK
jgi:hypothetical protein